MGFVEWSQAQVVFKTWNIKTIGFIFSGYGEKCWLAGWLIISRLSKVFCHKFVKWSCVRIQDSNLLQRSEIFKDKAQCDRSAENSGLWLYVIKQLNPLTTNSVEKKCCRISKNHFQPQHEFIGISLYGTEFPFHGFFLLLSFEMRRFGYRTCW